MKYEYGLKVWGGYFNDGVARPDAHREGTYFFSTAAERDAWHAELDAAAHAAGQCVASDLFEGEYARERTIASFILVVGETEYPMEYDFGCGYDAAGAHYMFEDGNYACDCNRSLFLRRLYGDVPGLPPDNEEMKSDDVVPVVCGKMIIMREFQVRGEMGPPVSFTKDNIGARLPAAKKI
jgi:hypothetical protein